MLPPCPTEPPVVPEVALLVPPLPPLPLPALPVLVAVIEVFPVLEELDVSIASPPAPDPVDPLPVPVDPTPLAALVSPDVPEEDPGSDAVNSPPHATKRPTDPQTQSQLVCVIVLHPLRLPPAVAASRSQRKYSSLE